MAELDASELPSGSVIETDIAVVGGGPAGLTLALALADAGANVTVLESGGHRLDARTQQLYAGSIAGLPYGPLDLARLRFLGGSTNHWEGYCRPLDASDFKSDPPTGFPGWPIGEAELAVHYARVHELCGLGPVDYRPQRWAVETGARLLPLDTSLVANDLLMRSPPIRFGAEYGEAVASHADVLLHANVVEIITQARRTVGVRLAGFDGATHEVRSPVVILATGGIENARLMLSSTDSAGRRLGDAAGLVGACFMEHPHVVAGYLETDPDLDLSFYLEPQDVEHGAVRGILSVPAEMRRAQGIGNVAATFDLVGGDPTGELPGIEGVDELRRVLTGSGRSVVHRVQLISEQMPAATSRVLLSRHQRDALGMPRGVLRWQLSPVDRRTLSVGAELIAAGLAASGLGRMLSLQHRGGPEPAFGYGHHHMGTTRMSDDPTEGVVDANCQVHGLEGLYVAGSSVFPTGGFANPTFTLLALALRLADHLREVF